MSPVANMIPDRTGRVSVRITNSAARFVSGPFSTTTDKPNLMRDPRINFRNRELAAVLAFLIPGAGHFYQGRRLKAGIYFTCILTLFFAGMVLGDWQPVYSQVAYATGNDTLQMQVGERDYGTDYSIGYAAQLFTGLPAVPSLIQQARFAGDAGVLTTLTSELDSDFAGVVGGSDGSTILPATGRLRLSPGRFCSGRFEGEARDGTPISFEITGPVELKLGREVFGSPRREIMLFGITDAVVDDMDAMYLRGTVSRSFINWYQAPRDNAELDRLHGKLSQNFDIACVFTWIAGLLNLMAIWDAYDGPAYGYGDEEPDEEDDEEDKDNSAPSKTKKSATATTAEA